jgi:predicted metal-dependent enzyme (double-stranded beta helix superfamily)
MEIWRVGHYSPIHSHASADAIIRVLHGNIFVELYPFLCSEKDGVEPFANASFKKDEITWISPTLNQIHKLTNLEKNKHTCITIQCYMYNDKNRTHYDYFDYLDVNGKVQQYEPDSDMDFVKFKELMKTEWTNRPRSFMDNVKHAFCPCCF